MTKLASLHTLLAVLRRRRLMVRWGMALAVVLLALLALLSTDFAIDWFFDMTHLQRFIALLLCAALFAWTYCRLARPLLRVQESEIDMALLVERQQNINGDLVAALQFEGSEGQAWGSAQLRAAVVDGMSERGKSLNVLEGFSARRLVSRAAVLGLALLGAGLFTAFYPAHVQAFFQRLCFVSARYPTRTVLVELHVNGTAVTLTAGGASSVRVPYGLPVSIKAQAAGEIPAEGKIVIQPAASRGTSSVVLSRASQTEPTFAANLPELVEPLSLEVFLGDSRTEPIKIEVIPLPVVETRATVQVPEYAQYAAHPAPQSSRQLTVFEGSRINLEVVATNKRLTAATLTIDDMSWPLQPAGEPPGSTRRLPGQVWTLDAIGTPLNAVSQPLHYEIQVTDEDGLHLAQPLRGEVRIKPDQRPQIAGGVMTRFVLPTAKPRIHYSATDDYGIARLTMHLDVARKDGTTDKRQSLPLRSLPQPLLRDKLPFKDVYPFELAQLKLFKGDRLTVTLEAVDYRGPTVGQSATSEPFVFEITDESGILEDIAKPDYRSAEELDAIIRQQLSIGGSK